MALPSLAPYPPISLRAKIAPEEWTLCVDAWVLLTCKYLLLPQESFEVLGEDHSLVMFLVSYIHNNASTTSRDDSPQSLILHRQCFRLAHRVMTEMKTIPHSMLEWTFLANMSLVYRHSRTLFKLLEEVWQANELNARDPIIRAKASLVSLLDKARPMSDLETIAMQAVALSKACYPCSQFLMIGSDLIDSICHAYNLKALPQKKAVTLLYVLLTSLMRSESCKTTTLLDHLFSLRSSPLLKAIIESTPFFQKFQRFLVGQNSDFRRAEPLLKDFESYSHPKLPHHESPASKKNKKGKGKDVTNGGEDKSLGMGHIHKLSLVTQIQDLFPHLGNGFILKLLDEYGDDAEQVTAHLLDDSLPQYLKEADRNEDFKVRNTESNSRDLVPNLAPHTAPPLLPRRYNIHDDDELDRLAVDASKLHFGRKNQDLTADKLLASERPSTYKASILSALAAFDPDDDERDDTYDAEDVGGTVDTTFADDEADAQEDGNEEILFRAYKRTISLFKRDADTRRSEGRATLKSETGMTDEAIEGWAIMLSRDPKRLQRLERDYEMGKGTRQRTLVGTSWKVDSENADSDDGTDVGGHEGGSQRNGGREAQGRGAAGPSKGPGTPVARQRKETNKGSRANHNRRDQRARKMARGGFPG